MRPDARKEYERWHRQATLDLEDAEYNAQGGRHNLACFLSQQAAGVFGVTSSIYGCSMLRSYSGACPLSAPAIASCSTCCSKLRDNPGPYPRPSGAGLPCRARLGGKGVHLE